MYEFIIYKITIVLHQSVDEKLIINIFKVMGSLYNLLPPLSDTRCIYIYILYHLFSSLDVSSWIIHHGVLDA